MSRRDCSKRRRRNKQGVLGHDSARKTRLGRFPRSETFLNLRRAEFHVELPIGNVECDYVAVRNCRDGAAVGGFRREMTSHKPVNRTRKNAVADQSDGIAETGAP